MNSLLPGKRGKQIAMLLSCLGWWAIASRRCVISLVQGPILLCIPSFLFRQTTVNKCSTLNLKLPLFRRNRYVPDWCTTSFALQVFKNRAYGDLAGVFWGNLMQGFSVGWWKNKHNTHHAVPNLHESSADAHDGKERGLFHIRRADRMRGPWPADWWQVKPQS